MLDISEGASERSVCCSVVSNSATPRTIACQAPQARILEWEALLQIFLTQGSNLGLLHCRQILYCLSHQGNPRAENKQHFAVSLSIFSVS